MTFKETLSHLTLYAQGMRVLYVEDESLIRENTALLLLTFFSQVETAGNGEDRKSVV